MNRLVRVALGSLAALTAVVSLAVVTTAPAASAPARLSPRHPRIVIKNFGYTGDLLVRPGVRVKVVNKDSVEHTLSHKDKGHFNTGPIPANGGVRFFQAPKRVGKFPFGCHFHPEMTGTLTVRRASGS